MGKMVGVTVGVGEGVVGTKGEEVGLGRTVGVEVGRFVGVGVEIAVGVLVGVLVGDGESWALGLPADTGKIGLVAITTKVFTTF